jgi:hypothetical protein
VDHRRPADVGDGAPAGIEQMRRRELSHLLVVGEHPVALDRRVIVAIDHDHRGAVLNQVLQDVGVARSGRRGDDDAVDLAAAEHRELGPLLVRILAGAAEQQAVAANARHRLDAGDDFHEEGVHQVGDHDAEGVGAAQAEASGNGVSLVAELVHLGEHPRAGRRADVVVVVEHFRDGGDRDPELAGDALHGGRVHGDRGQCRAL